MIKFGLNYVKIGNIEKFHCDVLEVSKSTTKRQIQSFPIKSIREISIVDNDELLVRLLRSRVPKIVAHFIPFS
jgi:hypothetical protein